MKNLFKIIYLLLLPLYSAFGQSTIGVSIHDTTMVVGDTIFVPVYVDSSLTGENVSSYNFQFSFNDNYFKVDSAFSGGTITSGWGAVTYNINTAERISVASAGSTNLSGTGILLYLRLIAIKSGTLNLLFTDAAHNYLNEGNPAVVLDNGRISISAKPTIRVNPNSETLTTGDTKQFSVSYGTAPYFWGVTNGAVATIDGNGLLTATSKGKTQVFAIDSNGIKDTTDGIVEVRAFKLSTRDTSHYQGQTVDIPVYTTDLTGLNYTAGEFTISIDGNILTPTEIITTGTLLSGYSTPNFSFRDGKLKIAFAGSTPLTGSGVLLIVRYQITSVNTGGTYLTFSDLLFNETDIGNSIRKYFRVLQLASLNISPSTGNLLVGETLQFSASNGTAPYSWSVSNSTLASIDATGLLTAVKGGVVTVSAQDTYGGTGSSGTINLFDTEVSIHDTTTDIGSVIDLPIYMADLSSSYSIVSMQTDILFDSSKVKFDQVITTGTSTNGWTFFTNDFGNKITIAGANTNGFNNASAIVKIRFNVSPNVVVGNYTNVTLENFLFNEGSPNAHIDNGRITIATASTPTAPSGLAATVVGSTEINLTWSDNSNNESGFKIERKTGSAGTWSQIASVSQNITTYNNSGLTVSTEYYYRVRSFNGVGNSAYSNEANATTSAGTPNAPTDLGAILDAVDSSGTIYVSWVDNSTNETGFILEHSINAVGSWNQLASLSADETFYTDTNLVDGTEYFYRVLAFNGNGNSAYSNVGSNTTIMNPPTNLTVVNPQTNKVVLNWEDNSMSETGYIIERQDGVNLPIPNFVAIDTVGTDLTTFTDSNFTTEVNYIYRVQGYNSKVISTYSNEVTITLVGIESEMNLPTKFELFQNYPNPFNPTTMIKFSIPEASFANVTIYNLLGEKVENLLSKNVGAGFYEITWNAVNIPSGMYLISVNFKSNNSQQTHSFTKKAILLK